MFSINSLDGNSFFDIGLKYRQMQIKELGDESYDAPSELRDTEKSSLSSSGDSSFSNFDKSFDKLHTSLSHKFGMFGMFSFTWPLIFARSS